MKNMYSKLAKTFNQRRNIANIVATFTKIRTQLQIAIEEEEKLIKINKANIDEANKVNLSEIKAAELVLAKAKKKSNGKLGEVLSKSIESSKAANDNISEAKKWLEQIPTID